MTKTARKLDLRKIRLDSGGHTWLGNGQLKPEQQMCVMEAVSWVAGEDWSDRPECVSPVIGVFLRSWNDTLDDAGRQKLKPYIRKVVGTVGTYEQEQTRGLMCADWYIRHQLPAWLELAGLKDIAAKVRALPSLESWDEVERATGTVKEARKQAAAARDAAWDAAGAAAWDAARAAAWDTARDAARAAAGAAAWDAARDAAWDTARDAARAAATEALKPTSLSLQASAFDLLDRMIAA